MEDCPELRIAIPPGTGLEFFRFLHRSYKKAPKQQDQLKNKDDFSSEEHFKRYLRSKWVAITSLEKLVGHISSDSLTGQKLLSLSAQGKLVDLHKLFKKSQLEELRRTDLVKTKVTNVDQVKGKSYLSGSRPGREEANFVDLLNFVFCVASQNFGQDLRIASHGRITLRGWDKIWIGPKNKNPARHSIALYYISQAKIMEGSWQSVDTFFSEGNFLLRRILKELHSIDTLRGVLERREIPSKEMLVSISPSLSIAMQDWVVCFYDKLIPMPLKDKQRKEELKKTDVSAEALMELMKSSVKNDVRGQIKRFAQDMYTTGILLTEDDMTFFPRDESTDEIVRWLRQ